MTIWKKCRRLCRRHTENADAIHQTKLLRDRPVRADLSAARSEQLDYEAELAIVIGKTCRRVPKERANEVIAGSMVANDVSIRDWQMASQTMTMGKSWDSHCPMGYDGAPDELDMKTWILSAASMVKSAKARIPAFGIRYPDADQLSLRVHAASGRCHFDRHHLRCGIVDGRPAMAETWRCRYLRFWPARSDRKYCRKRPGRTRIE